jgi:uncharacterized RDD family membrane protein YckC
MQSPENKFAGFWRRLGAALIDVVLIIIVTFPILIAIYGMDYFDYDRTGFIAGPADFLISYLLPAIATVWFWMRFRATPGKIALRARIVDARTGDTLTLRQSVLRYLGYFVSLLPLGLGYLWVAFDPRKQGWHDKIAGTVVTYGPQPFRGE